MKKILLAAGIVLLGGVIIFAANRKETDVIRFHVKANSDSAADQRLKLKVRDELLEHMRPRMEGVSSTAQAREAMQQMLPELTSIADGVIRADGAAYRARVTLGRREFPTRNYGGREYPQGEYEALMVELGEAQGENWWCVAYPTLCFSFLDNEDGEAPVKRSLFDIVRSWFE